MLDLALFLQRFSSPTLWHFTGYGKTDDAAFKILVEILESRCLKVAARQEEILMSNGDKRWGLRISCMCDIPFSDLRIHMIRYGKFGISFYKKEAISKGLFNPVLYIHKSSPVMEEMSALLPDIEKLAESQPELREAIERFLLLLGSYSKRSDLLHAAEINPEKDKSQDNNFYYEREWRSIRYWNFSDQYIAAITMPNGYLKRFYDKFGGRFSRISIISSEIVGIL